MFLLRNSNPNSNSNDSNKNYYGNSSYSILSSNYRLFCQRYGHIFQYWSCDNSNSTFLTTNNLSLKYVAFPWFLHLYMYKYIVSSKMFLLRNNNFNDSSNNHYANSSYRNLSYNYRLFCHRYSHTFHIWSYDKINSHLLITNNFLLKYVAFPWLLRLCIVTSNMFRLRNANINDSSNNNYAISRYSILSSNYRLFC